MDLQANKAGTYPIWLRPSRAVGLSTPSIGCVLNFPGLPGGGSKIYDRSPYGNIGTIIGATWKRLPSGLWVLGFDGSDDFIDCGDISAVIDNTKGTVIAWVNVSAAGNVVTGGLNTSSQPYLMLLSQGIYGYDGIHEDIALGNTGAEDGNWHQEVWLSDGSAWKFYIDAVEQTLTWSAGSNHGYWFKHYDGAGGGLNNIAVGVLNRAIPYGYFSGAVGEVTVYNRPLTPLEIQYNYLATKWRYR